VVRYMLPARLILVSACVCVYCDAMCLRVLPTVCRAANAAGVRSITRVDLRYSMWHLLVDHDRDERSVPLCERSSANHAATAAGFAVVATRSTGAMLLMSRSSSRLSVSWQMSMLSVITPVAPARICIATKEGSLLPSP